MKELMKQYLKYDEAHVKARGRDERRDVIAWGDDVGFSFVITLE